MHSRREYAKTHQNIFTMRFICILRLLDWHLSVPALSGRKPKNTRQIPRDATTFMPGRGSGGARSNQREHVPRDSETGVSFTGHETSAPGVAGRAWSLPPTAAPSRCQIRSLRTQLSYLRIGLRQKDGITSSRACLAVDRQRPSWGFPLAIALHSV